jgi:hypothetical protein
MRQPHSIEHGPSGRDVFKESGFSPRRRIGGNDIEPASQEEGGPTRPDEAGADDTHTFDCTLGHLVPFQDSLRISLIRRASPLGLPYTLSRAPLRRRAPIAWLARNCSLLERAAG